MKKLLYLIVLISSFSALSFTDVTCKGGNCLKNGWSEFDSSNNVTTYYYCRMLSDCTKFGWQEANAWNPVVATISCKPGDIVANCFSYGYSTFKMGKKINEVTCKKYDCLKNGWFEEDLENSHYYEATCIDSDCSQNGWLKESYLLPVEYLTVCKDGGCFVNGYQTTQYDL